MCRYKIVFDADMEEPDCCRCDYCCKDEKACDCCGPEYGWYGYKRTEYLELEDEDKGE